MLHNSFIKLQTQFLISKLEQTLKQFPLRGICVILKNKIKYMCKFFQYRLCWEVSPGLVNRRKTLYQLFCNEWTPFPYCLKIKCFYSRTENIHWTDFALRLSGRTKKSSNSFEYIDFFNEGSFSRQELMNKRYCRSCGLYRLQNFYDPMHTFY